MFLLTSQLHKPDPVGPLPKPCNAGLIDIEWVIEDLTKSEVPQSWWNEVFRIKKVPLQGFSSVPTGFGLGVFCNVKVYYLTIYARRKIDRSPRSWVGPS